MSSRISELTPSAVSGNAPSVERDEQLPAPSTSLTEEVSAMADLLWDLEEALMEKEDFLARPPHQRKEVLRSWLHVYRTEAALRKWHIDNHLEFQWLFGKVTLMHNHHSPSAEDQIPLTGPRAGWSRLPQPAGKLDGPPEDGEDLSICRACDALLGDFEHRLRFCHECQPFPRNSPEDADRALEISYIAFLAQASKRAESFAGSSTSIKPSDSQVWVNFTSVYAGMCNTILHKKAWSDASPKCRKELLCNFITYHNQAKKHNVCRSDESANFHWMHGKLQVMHTTQLRRARIMDPALLFVPAGGDEKGWDMLPRPEGFLPDIDYNPTKPNCWTCETPLMPAERAAKRAFCNVCERAPEVTRSVFPAFAMEHNIVARPDTPPAAEVEERSNDRFIHKLTQLHGCLTNAEKFLSEYTPERRRKYLDGCVNVFRKELSSISRPAGVVKAFKWLFNQVKILHNENVTALKERYDLPNELRAWARVQKPQRMPLGLTMPDVSPSAAKAGNTKRRASVALSSPPVKTSATKKAKKRDGETKELPIFITGDTSSEAEEDEQV